MVTHRGNGSVNKLLWFGGSGTSVGVDDYLVASLLLVNNRRRLLLEQWLRSWRQQGVPTNLFLQLLQMLNLVAVLLRQVELLLDGPGVLACGCGFKAFLSGALCGV
jgi:hypothetical protein